MCSGERVLSVHLGEKKERDEEEGEQEKARTVGEVHVGGWVDVGCDVCVCEGVECPVGEKEGREEGKEKNEKE